MSDSRVLVVGTTPDYIAYIDEHFPGRALFVTDFSKRAEAKEAAPDKASEIVCDLLDKKGVGDALTKHLEAHRLSLSGVTCYDCEWLSLAAELAIDFGLPYPTVESVRLARDKFQTKRKWIEKGVRCPKVELVQSGKQALGVIDRFGHSVVLKPLTGSGSELTFRCDDKSDLTTAFQQIRDGLAQRSQLPMYKLDHSKADSELSEHDVLAEEFVEGREYSADFIIEDDKVTLIRVSKKLRSDSLPFGTTMAYVVPARLPGWLNDSVLIDKLHGAAVSLGLKRAICMVDFIISQDEIVFLELTPRIGGDCLPPLVRQCCGLDTIGLSLDFAEGKKCEIPPKESWTEHVGLRLFAPRSGVLDNVECSELTDDPKVKEIYIKRDPGHEITVPPEDYDSWLLGHVIFESERDQCLKTQCKKIYDKITINIDQNQDQKLAAIQKTGSELLNRKVPLLDSEELRTFVRSFIDRREELLAAVEREGSPLYVIDNKALIDKARRFQGAFEAVLPDVQVFYALKSNSHPVISSTLVEEGLGLDVSSGLELKAALKCRPKEIIFSGPGKQPDELELAVDNADKVTILIDSFGELAKLRKVTDRVEKSIRAGVRLTTKGSGIWKKFGIPLNRLSAFFDEADRADFVDLRGLQFHISWNLNPSQQVAFITELGVVLKQLDKKHRDKIKFIDIGGGFWPEQGEWLQSAATPQGMFESALGEETINGLRHYKKSAHSITDFASRISVALKEMLPDDLKCVFYLEPGRWLCHDAMHILQRVADVKSSDMVITDGGTNAVGWERFETDYFPVINLTRPSLKERECLVAGSLCTPHDIWGYSYFGESIEEGDVLLIPNQGAYTYSLRQEFIKALPDSVSLIDIETAVLADQERLNPVRSGERRA